jgi:YYY domain-containing protein
MLTGTPARYAYNLALASFYGMLVMAAYSVAGAITAARGGSYRLAGSLAVLFVGFASNLVAPLAALLWLLPRRMATDIATVIASPTALDASRLLSRDAFSYWTPSRVITGTINEFPLFAWLNGDLHAHMLSTPFLLLLTGVAYTYYRTPSDAVRRRRLLLFGVIPPIAGLIAVINTWSFPTTIGVTWLAMVFAPASPLDVLPEPLHRRVSDEVTWKTKLRRIGVATGLAVLVAFIGLLWTAPFFLGPATGTGNRTIGLFPDQSSLIGLLLVHGWFLLVFGLYLGYRIWKTTADRLLLGGAVVIPVLVGIVGQIPAVILVVPLLVVAGLLLRKEDTVEFESVLFVAGAGLVLLVEFIYLEAQAAPGRMNTVFKIYMQVWVLWGVGAAVAVERLLPGRPSRWSTGEWRQPAFAVIGIVLLLTVSLYGMIALGNHSDGTTDPTLDATRWAQEQHPDEWEAIQFLASKPGQPNIVTAPAC